jgi:hypothetical protein
MTRILAIDWSGALAGAHKSIRLAEARDGELVRVEGGRGREEVIHFSLPQSRMGGINSAGGSPRRP